MSNARESARRTGIGLLVGMVLAAPWACQTGVSDLSDNLPVSIGSSEVFDRAAVQRAIQPFTAEDLSGFNFQLFFVLQNASGGDLSFTVAVGGADQPRKTIAANRQGLVVVQGSACPQSVTFRDFVTTNAYTVTDIQFDRGEQTNLDVAQGANPTFACPAIIVLVFRSNRVEALELDRELTAVADPGTEEVVNIVTTP